MEYTDLSSAENSAITRNNDLVIPTQLKFLLNNLKTTLTIQLTADNYAIWQAQILKLFQVNDFESHLDGTLTAPLKLFPIPNAEDIMQLIPDCQIWNLTDQKPLSMQ